MAVLMAQTLFARGSNISGSLRVGRAFSNSSLSGMTAAEAERLSAVEAERMKEAIAAWIDDQDTQSLRFCILDLRYVL